LSANADGRALSDHEPKGLTGIAQTRRVKYAHHPHDSCLRQRVLPARVSRQVVWLQVTNVRCSVRQRRRRRRSAACYKPSQVRDEVLSKYRHTGTRRTRAGTRKLLEVKVRRHSEVLSTPPSTAHLPRSIKRRGEGQADKISLCDAASCSLTACPWVQWRLESRYQGGHLVDDQAMGLP